MLKQSNIDDKNGRERVSLVGIEIVSSYSVFVAISFQIYSDVRFYINIIYLEFVY